jgi:hypothetical protein
MLHNNAPSGCCIADMNNSPDFIYVSYFSVDKIDGGTGTATLIYFN